MELEEACSIFSPEYLALLIMICYRVTNPFRTLIYCACIPNLVSSRKLPLLHFPFLLSCKYYALLAEKCPRFLFPTWAMCEGMLAKFRPQVQFCSSPSCSNKFNGSLGLGTFRLCFWIQALQILPISRKNKSSIVYVRVRRQYGERVFFPVCWHYFCCSVNEFPQQYLPVLYFSASGMFTFYDIRSGVRCYQGFKMRYAFDFPLRLTLGSSFKYQAWCLHFSKVQSYLSPPFLTLLFIHYEIHLVLTPSSRLPFERLNSTKQLLQNEVLFVHPLNLGIWKKGFK